MMYMKKSMILSVLLMTGYVAQAQTVQLRINPIEGQTCTMENQVISNTNQSFMGQEITAISTMKTQVHFEVNSVGETTFEMTAYYVDLFMTVESQGQKISYEVEGKDEVSMAFKALLNKPFQVSMDKRSGKVIKIEGAEAAFAEVEEALAPLSRAKRRTAMDAAKPVGEGGIKNCAESSFANYPENALKTGQAWMRRDTSLVENMGGRVFSDSQNKLVSFDTEKAEVTHMGMMQTDPDNAPAMQNGAEVSLQMGGSQSGKAIIDLATGWILESTSTAALSGSAEANMQGNSMNIPIKITIESVVKRLE